MTPVRTVAPSIRVTWPTRTPATSVIALSGPVGRMPIVMPRSRARGRALGRRGHGQRQAGEKQEKADRNGGISRPPYSAMQGGALARSARAHRAAALNRRGHLWIAPISDHAAALDARREVGAGPGADVAAALHRRRHVGRIDGAEIQQTAAADGQSELAAGREAALGADGAAAQIAAARSDGTVISISRS